MNLEQIKPELNRLMCIFDKSFINHNLELIIEPKNNIYFRLEDVNTKQELDIKVISYLSRPSFKGLSVYWQRKFFKGFNEYLKTDFSVEDIELIYTYLGNGCNSSLCGQFILSGYDIEILRMHKDANQQYSTAQSLDKNLIKTYN